MNYLLIRARKGDKNAEIKLFEYLGVRFSYLAKQRVGEGACEDIVQDACLTVLQKYLSLEDTVEFEAWAYKVLRNKIGNYYQKLAQESAYIVKSGDVLEYQQRNDINENLRLQIENCLQKINKVNPRYYRILKLVSEGYKTNEIAEKLHVKPNNLYVILNRSRNMLKDCLKK